MSNEKQAPWVGASGAEYRYHVFGLEPDVPSRPGSYIYAKRNADDAWVPIYMGHGDLAARCNDPALLQSIAASGPTHIHLRLNKRPEDREDERRDLLARYDNAFPPEGCQPEADRPRDLAAPTAIPAAAPASATPPAGVHLSDPLPDPT